MGADETGDWIKEDLYPREMLRAKAGSPVSLWSAMIRSVGGPFGGGMPSDPGFKMSIQSSGGWVLTRAM